MAGVAEGTPEGTATTTIDQLKRELELEEERNPNDLASNGRWRVDDRHWCWGQIRYNSDASEQ